MNEIIFDVEFSTDAKFMCHRHALEGDASDKYKPLHRKISLSELEINNPHVKPVNDQQHESELNLRAATLGLRYLYSISQHSWRNFKEKNLVQIVIPQWMWVLQSEQVKGYNCQERSLFS